ncbi:hypothetical protein [Sphingobacterium sp. SYP-B4668]|uniref:hypothetical protein n=1 Tax=Sphingobacterium sp. SYP-B4668 TaxID=2996035 RepID=UPI0022DCF71F|nr:hypothetical protein [Sphingobacterium sp. SYP-B4668]
MGTLAIIKKNAMLLVALTIATATFVAAGISKQPNVKKVLASQWYNAELINPTGGDVPSNIRVKDPIAPPSGSCDPANNNEICAVYLDLTNFTAPTPEGMTLEEATNATNKALLDENSGGNNDGFAKHN